MFSMKNSIPSVRRTHRVGSRFLLFLVGFVCISIVEGCTFVNTDCTLKCVCLHDQINCNTNYRCSSHAECRDDNGIRRCYCQDGFWGDGETCTPVTPFTSVTPLYTDCYDAYQGGNTADGVYTIYPSEWQGEPIKVLCNMTTDGGGWTVFQRRIDGVSKFYRNWLDYKDGFGYVSQNDDFWLGNEQLYHLTKQRAYELRVDITLANGSSLYARYASFWIANEALKYQLSVSPLTAGDAGDGLYVGDNGGFFTTGDQDNDQCSYRNCAEGVKGAGWYTSEYCYPCRTRGPVCSTYGKNDCVNWCSYFNLNGVYNGVNGQSIYWYTHCNLKYADMKIRPRLR